MANRIPRGRRAKTGTEPSRRRKRRTASESTSAGEQLTKTTTTRQFEIIGQQQPPPSLQRKQERARRRSASQSAATSETSDSTDGSGRTPPESPGASFDYSPRKIGRPSKINDVLIRQRKKPDGSTESYEITVADAILEVIRLGNYKETAARFAGVNDATLFRWLEKGDPDGEEPDFQIYRDFRAALEKTEAEAEARDVSLILDAAQPTIGKDGKVIAKGEWQAAAWRRERMDPGRYGKREHIVIRQEMAVQLASDVIELTKLALERHVSDPEQRKAVLKDIIAGGLAIADRAGGSVQADRASGSA